MWLHQLLMAPFHSTSFKGAFTGLHITDADVCEAVKELSVALVDQAARKRLDLAAQKRLAVGCTEAIGRWRLKKIESLSEREREKEVIQMSIPCLPPLWRLDFEVFMSMRWGQTPHHKHKRYKRIPRILLNNCKISVIQLILLYSI